MVNGTGISQVRGSRHGGCLWYGRLPPKWVGKIMSRRNGLGGRDGGESVKQERGFWRVGGRVQDVLAVRHVQQAKRLRRAWPGGQLRGVVIADNAMSVTV